MAKVDTVVCDKTGTLTTNQKNIITYEGLELSEEEKQMLTGTLRASNHPLSRALYGILEKNNIKTPEEFEEEVGKGIFAKFENNSMKVGAYDFVREQEQSYTPESIKEEGSQNRTVVHISSNDTY